jgi:hypothetical protein
MSARSPLTFAIAGEALAVVCIVSWFATYVHFHVAPTNDSPLADLQDALYDRRWGIMMGLGIAASVAATGGAIVALRNRRIGLGLLGAILTLAGLALAVLAWALSIPWG